MHHVQDLVAKLSADRYDLHDRDLSIISFDVRGTWKVPANRCITLLWRHNGCSSVSNHQPHDCLLNRLLRRRSKKTSKLRVTGFCAGNHRGPVNSPHKWPVTRKMLPFDDVIMICCYHRAVDQNTLSQLQNNMTAFHVYQNVKTNSMKTKLSLMNLSTYILPFVLSMIISFSKDLLIQILS